MKKKKIGSLVVILLIGCISIGITACSSSKIVSKDEAKKIALEHAGVKESDIKNFTIELENYDKTSEYDIKFYSSNMEYDYTINAQTGAIIDSEFDVDNKDDQNSNIVTDNSSNNNSSTSTTTNDGTPSNVISEAEAKKIALDKVPGASDSDIRIHLDKEDGKHVYDGSIIYDSTEYDFEIDAQSGNVIEWDYETVKK